MSRNGSGVYSLPAGNPVVTGTTISSSWANTTLSDIATALTGSIAADGQTAMTGNLQMGNNKITGLAVATATGDALSYGQAATVTTLTTTGNVTIGGTLTLTGGLTLNGNVTVGDASTDTLTVNATSTFAAGATFSSTFAANGGATLGDASGDALTINSSAVSIPNGLNFDSNTLVIDATNNRVGVGTASPAGTFQVVGATDQIRAGDGTSTAFLGGSASSGYTGTITNHPFIFYTNSVEQIRITSAGSVGIGIASPSHKLQVFTSSSNIASFTRDLSTDVSLNVSADNDGTVLETGGVHNFRVFTNGSEKMRITSAGNVGIGTSSPGSLLDTRFSTNPTVDNAIGNNTLRVYTSVAQSADVGGAISLGGLASGSQLVGFGQIAGRKDNSTVSHYAGYLQFCTTASGGTMSEKMRLDSSGNLGLGVTPSASNTPTLQMAGGAALAGLSGGWTFLGNNWYYNAGSKYIANGVASLYEQVSGKHAWYTAPSGTAGNAITFTQAMTLDADGDLGIGTTNPTNALDITRASGVSTYIRLLQSGVESWQIGMPATVGSLAFLNSGVERMRIDTAGNLLVGATGTLNNNKLFVAKSSLVVGINVLDGIGEACRFYSNGTAVGTISVTGSATAYNTSSDYRLKENIAPMTGALDRVAQLKPVTYSWKVDGSAGEGFIAHELQSVVPECVTGEKDAVDAEGNPQYQGIDTSFLVATLTAAIQELKAEVDALKAQINQ
jgi:hypothetical protein